MKKFLLLLTLINFNVYAGIGFWCPAEPGVIRNPQPDGECYQVDPDTFVPETAVAINGVLSIDNTKKAARDAAIAARQAALASKLSKIAACESLYSGVDSLSTVAQIRELLKCLVRDAR